MEREPPVEDAHTEESGETEERGKADPSPDAEELGKTDESSDAAKRRRIDEFLQAGGAGQAGDPPEEEGPSPPGDDSDLVIVRDMVDMFAIEANARPPKPEADSPDADPPASAEPPEEPAPEEPAPEEPAPEEPPVEREVAAELVEIPEPELGEPETTEIPDLEIAGPDIAGPSAPDPDEPAAGPPDEPTGNSPEESAGETAPDEGAARRREYFQVDWEEELREARPSTFARVPGAGAPASSSRTGAGPDRSSSRADVPLPPEREPAERAARSGRTSEAPRASLLAVWIGAGVFLTATVLMAFRIEPFATWYYLFAWYPFLLLVNHGTARRAAARSVFGAGARTVGALLAWSVPTWLFFEIWNFRLENWYYVGVPDALLARRIGVSLSFATILPAFVFLEDYLRTWNVFAGTRTPRFPTGPRVQLGLLIVGAVSALLVLLIPAVFFPLVWGVPVLLLEPWLLRRGDRASFLSSLSRGRPGRALRLLVAGVFCGLFWEAANYFALGKWIYTVPGLEAIKLFEMPPLGFVGFAPFALCCWSIVRALVQLGLLPEWDREGAKTPPRSLARGRRAGVVAAAVVLSLLTLAGMDRWTVDSFTPRPEDIPGVPDGVAEYARRHGARDVHGLLRLIRRGELDVPGESGHEQLALLEQRCRLVLLRGIGTANVRRLDRVGVRTVAQLASRDPEGLRIALGQLDESGWKPRARRIEVWSRAARAAQ